MHWWQDSEQSWDNNGDVDVNLMSCFSSSFVSNNNSAITLSNWFFDEIFDGVVIETVFDVVGVVEFVESEVEFGLKIKFESLSIWISFQIHFGIDWEKI